MTDKSPFVLDVSHALRDNLPEQFRKVGDAPVRIGAEMIGVAQGAEVEVDGLITNLGGGVLVDATVSAPLSGECVRCLAPVSHNLDIHISAVFSGSDDFITGEEVEEGEDEIGEIVDNTVDITQAVIDEAVLSLPFNPTCESFGGRCEVSETEVPAPDGVVGEANDNQVDPRWAGLAQKFSGLADSPN